MRSVKELWSKSFGVFVFFLTRIKQAKARLLLDDDDLPKKLYYWVLCKSDLKHLNFCVSVAWFPFFALLWPRGQKLTPENYLFTFFPSLSPFFFFFQLQIFEDISFTANETIPFLFDTKQDSGHICMIFYGKKKDLTWISHLLSKMKSWYRFPSLKP